MLGALDFTEILISRRPVVVRRRVAWGDCDPAGVVYTPRFADYVISARDWFTRYGLGFADRPHPRENVVTFPSKALSFEFQSYLAADDIFDMTVEVAAISRRTFTMAVAADHVSRVGRAFTASLTSVCVERAGGAAISLSDEVRSALERYRAGPPCFRGRIA